jgi:hypothetical protein
MRHSISPFEMAGAPIAAPPARTAALISVLRFTRNPPGFGLFSGKTTAIVSADAKEKPAIALFPALSVHGAFPRGTGRLGRLINVLRGPARD